MNNLPKVVTQRHLEHDSNSRDLLIASPNALPVAPARHLTYHVDDLCERQSEGHVERFAGVQRRTYSMIVVAQQVAYQPVLDLVRCTCDSCEYRAFSFVRSFYSFKTIHI